MGLSDGPESAPTSASSPPIAKSRSRFGVSSAAREPYPRGRKSAHPAHERDDLVKGEVSLGGVGGAHGAVEEDRLAVRVAGFGERGGEFAPRRRQHRLDAIEKLDGSLGGKRRVGTRLGARLGTPRGPHASLEEGDGVGLGHIDGGGDERGDVRARNFLPRASHPRLRKLGLEKIPRGGQRRLEKPLVRRRDVVGSIPAPARVEVRVRFRFVPGDAGRSRTAAAPPSSAAASASSTRAAVRLTRPEVESPQKICDVISKRIRVSGGAGGVGDGGDQSVARGVT